MKVFIGGVNGSGKTTVLTAFQESHPSYKVIGSSKGFSAWLGFEGDYEKLRSLQADDRDRKLAQYMKEILSTNDNFLLDSHYLNLVRGVITKTTDEWIQGFDAIVLIRTDFDSLWNRITHDERDRALFPEGISEAEKKEILANYQKQYREEFLRIAQIHGLRHVEITNDTVENAVSVLESLFI